MNKFKNHVSNLLQSSGHHTVHAPIYFFPFALVRFLWQRQHCCLLPKLLHPQLGHLQSPFFTRRDSPSSFGALHLVHFNTVSLGITVPHRHFHAWLFGILGTYVQCKFVSLLDEYRRHGLLTGGGGGGVARALNVDSKF